MGQDKGKDKGKDGKDKTGLGNNNNNSVPPSTSSYELPWVEKYRPMTLDDVVGNSEVIDRLRVVAKNGNMPNLLLCGPPGCGKTTAIMALARETLGGQIKNGLLELNASDDRGIDTVRNKIKMFAQTKVTLPPGRHKIVLLDEADSMTGPAQQALRRTMELHSNTTRFALACNLSSKIIEPIQSRCAVVRFRRLSDAEVRARAAQVVKEYERIPASKLEEDGIDAAVFTADGDMRIALNNLQSTWNGFEYISADNVNRVCDQPQPKVVARFLELCGKRRVDDAIDALMSLVDQGYATNDIVQTVFRVARGLKTDKEINKLNMLREIGLVHMRIADGVSSSIQLAALTAKLCKL